MRNNLQIRKFPNFVARNEATPTYKVSRIVVQDARLLRLRLRRLSPIWGSPLSLSVRWKSEASGKPGLLE
jgi:hypothetical protein